MFEQVGVVKNVGVVKHDKFDKKIFKNLYDLTKS